MHENPPSAVATPIRPIEAYDTIHEVNGSGKQPVSVVLADWILDDRPGNVAAFEENQEELFDLVKMHTPEFVSRHLLRYLGSKRTYLVVRGSTDQTVRPPAPSASAEVRAFNEAHPAKEFASNSNVAERYEVIQRI